MKKGPESAINTLFFWGMSLGALFTTIASIDLVNDVYNRGFESNTATVDLDKLFKVIMYGSVTLTSIGGYKLTK